MEELGGNLFRFITWTACVEQHVVVGFIVDVKLFIRSILTGNIMITGANIFKETWLLLWVKLPYCQVLISHIFQAHYNKPGCS